jgi:hypothetical protein
MARRQRAQQSAALAPPAVRQKMLEDARAMLGAAGFFLSRMRALDGSPNLETDREFHYHFWAFLAMARSSLQILCPCQRDWAWAIREVASKGPGVTRLYQVLTDLRDRVVHVEKVVTQVDVEFVPEAALRPIHRPRGVGLVRMPTLPGTPPTTHGVNRYKIHVGPDLKDAVECCTRYLDLMRHLVDHREGMATW